MDIQDFTDLTNFVYTEYEKLAESCGVQNAPDKLLKSTNKTINSYINLYNKVLYRREKRQLILQEAIETMPHNYLWKIFHFKLWKQIQRELSTNLENEKEKPKLKEETVPSFALAEIVPPAEISLSSKDV